MDKDWHIKLTNGFSLEADKLLVLCVATEIVGMIPWLPRAFFVIMCSPKGTHTWSFSLMPKQLTL